MTGVQTCALPILDYMLLYVDKTSKYETDAISYTKHLIKANNNQITDSEIETLLEDVKSKPNSGETSNNGKGISIGYTENDETNPINIYGESKLAGEKYVQEILDKYYIVRTSWVFNINGKNFIETMLRLSKANNQLSIVNDQIGSPTYTKDLSRLLVDMLETSKYGLYHATNEGYCSWYEFANTIFKLANINIDIKAINSNEYASRAKRPMNSKLSKDKLIEYGFKPLPHWEDALKDYLIRRGDLLI